MVVEFITFSCCTTMHLHVVRLYLLMLYGYNMHSRTTWEWHKNSLIFIPFASLLPVG